MATKKKRVDPIKQREKRVKIAAIVGVVVFVLAAAYEVPSMLKVMNQKPPVGTRYDPGPSLTPGGLPNVALGSTSSTSLPGASRGQLVDTDVPPPSGAGQLVSFSVFQTKNPFTPQVTTAQPPPDTSGVTTTTTTTTTASKPGAVVPGGTTTTPTGTLASAVPSSLGSQTTTTPTTTTAPQPTVAISVNGVVSHVASSGTFPTGAPVFRLVSWKKGSAQVAIVGGSYSAGGATLTLQVGQSVTLENQTNSKRYTLELLST